MVEVTVQLPDEIAKQFGEATGEIPRHILEAVALEGYRSAKLSCAQVSELLHLDSQQTDQFLAERQAQRQPALEADHSQRDLDWEAFQKALPELLQTDRDHFVAISGGKVVDRDPDEFALVERIAQQRPAQQVLVQKVVESGLMEVHIDTPEFEFVERQVG